MGLNPRAGSYTSSHAVGSDLAVDGVRSRTRRFIAVLLIVYCAKQILTATLFPPFTGHDEVAHWQSIRVLATEGRLPTLYKYTLPG